MVNTTFVALAAAGTVAVFAWALRPLWRAHRAGGWAMVVALSLATMALYFAVGTPAALDPARRAPPDPLAAAISQLEAQLATRPDAEGWRLLGRSLASQGQRERARDAFSRAVALAPDDPGLLVDAAESRALARTDRRFDPQATAWLESALRRDPTQQRARWFLGIARRQVGDDAGAVAAWTPLLDQVDASTAAALRPQLDAARKAAGMAPLPAATRAPGAAESGLRVTVTLDASLRGGLPPGARVFVIARMPGGPAMPVAVETLDPAALPATVVLDDADSPMPTRTLSQAGEVEVLARLSRSGIANAAPGDLASNTVRVGASRAPVRLRITAPR